MAGSTPDNWSNRPGTKIEQEWIRGVRKNLTFGKGESFNLFEGLNNLLKIKSLTKSKQNPY